MAMTTAIAISSLMAAPSVGAATPEEATVKEIPGLSMASNMFRNYCIANRTDIAALIEVLPEAGFAWMPETKRFVHPTHDLAFALLQSEAGFACSMIFATDSNPTVSAALFTKNTSTREVIVNVGFPPKSAGRDYINAMVAAQ